jgi:N-acetylneuraminate synthase
MNRISQVLKIDGREISLNSPCYFIADIAANHDGSLQRAKYLIAQAKAAGADAAKFQHFKADKIVSDFGFKSLKDLKSHQNNWDKSVYEVYQDASLDDDWTDELKVECDRVGITFFTSPYDLQTVDSIDEYVAAYKIGSGDITWHEIIKHIASKNKPYIIATGASKFEDVVNAVNIGLSINPNIALLQCNTNYTGSIENMRHVNLNVIKTYRAMFPNMILGLSDHTPGFVTVLGAVALGAKIIEKHFTDDKTRIGPDHAFSMDVDDWREMVYKTRELEAAMGCGVKKVEANEAETVVLQRRALRVVSDLNVGHIITSKDLIPLRPCPKEAFEPWQEAEILGKMLNKPKTRGDFIAREDV